MLKTCRFIERRRRTHGRACLCALYGVIRRGQAAAGEERGLTLVELIVTMVMSLIVFGAVVQFAVVGQNVGRNDTARSAAVNQAAQGLYSMTHELRQGYAPTSAQNCSSPCAATAPTSTNVLDVIVCSSSTCARVKYDCTITSPSNSSYKECCRYSSSTLTASPASQTGTTSSPCGSSGRLVIDRLVGPTYVFQPTSGATSPSYYQVTIDVPQKGDFVQGASGNYELSDGIYLHNVAGDV